MELLIAIFLGGWLSAGSVLSYRWLKREFSGAVPFAGDASGRDEET